MDKTTTRSVSWQHPFVDVFKYFKVFEPTHGNTKGNVTQFQDKTIGRNTFKIIGSTPASNYLALPCQKSSNIKSLGLQGRYIYLQLQTMPNKYFYIHLDFEIEGQDNCIRVSISNQYSQLTVKTNVIQVPYPVDSQCEKWCVIVMDIVHILDNSGINQHTSIQTYENLHSMKSAQICSNLVFRGIYTSSQLYNPENLPKEMSFKSQKDKNWEDFYQSLFYPKSLQNKLNEQPPLQRQKEIYDDKSNHSSLHEQIQRTNDKNMFMLNKSQSSGINQFDESQHEEKVEQSIKSMERSQQMECKEIKDVIQKPIHLHPILSLKHTLGFSAKNCPDIKWSDTQDLLYASGGILVSSNLQNKSQKFFIGHTKSISCMDLSKDNKYLVTAQEGPQVVIKIWDYEQAVCIFSWPTKYSEVKNVSFSYNKELLCTVGVEEKNKESIIVWQIAGTQKFKKPSILAKQTSDFNIISAKFSPIENDKIVSCGRENIRFWRIKQGHLPGCAVILNHHARNTVFTVFDYEYTSEEPFNLTQQVKRVFVGSKLGLLFQVNYHTRELEGVFKVHDSTICSIKISAGFCVTGSDDQFLRVWPLDFSEFFLEAKHEGVVSSLDISNDGLLIACGASNGGLGIMDLGKQSYKTILRSHTDEIIQLVYHSFSKQFISLSKDLTIRIWDVQNLEQIYEFSYPAEDQCTYISASPSQNIFAGGFQSGVFRIFDIESTNIVNEGRYHNSPIKQVVYSPDGNHLTVVDSICHYIVHDANTNYQPVKLLDQEIPSENPFCSYRQDAALMLTVGDSGSHINIYETKSYSLILKFFTPNIQIRQLGFSANLQEIIVVSTDCRVRQYGYYQDQSMFEVYFLREAPAIHREQINDFNVTQNQEYLVTVGSDQLIKVWDYEWEQKTPQVFVAHVQKINSVLILDNMLVTCAGSEGIYLWSINEDVGGLPQESDFSELKPVARKIYNILVDQEVTIQEESLDHQGQNQIEQDDQIDYEGGDIEQCPTYNSHAYEDNDRKTKIIQQPIKMSMTDKLRQQQKLSNKNQQQQFQVQTLPHDFKPETNEFRKQRAKKIKQQSKKYKINATRQQYQLPFKHLFIENYKEIQTQIDEKIENLRENSDVLALEYISGFNSDSHENLVWNYMKGWFGFTLQNMIIIEDLDKIRKQKVITLPEQIGCLLLNQDGTKIIVGSSLINTQNQTANIYIMDTSNFVITKTLSFHTRGVQQMQLAKDDRYLISVGNFRESTIAIWDFNTGKLMTSSYTLDKINDVKVSPRVFQDGLFEFCTVGKDQVQFWAFTKMMKLEYYDVFVEKQENGKLQELTSCDYIDYEEDLYVIVGSVSGDILVIEYGNGFAIKSCDRVCNNEVVKIQTNQVSKRIIVSALDGNLYYYGFDKFQPEKTSYYKFALPSSASSFALDEELNEGLFSGFDGGNLFK